jgi:hypothetical protein
MKNRNGNDRPSGNGASTRSVLKTGLTSASSPPEKEGASVAIRGPKHPTACPTVEEVEAAYASNGQHVKHAANGQHRYAEGEFFIAPKAALTDNRLGALAFRVLCYVLSKGSAYQVHPRRLQKQLSAGRDAIRHALRQLEAVGCAQLVRVSLGKGRISSRWQFTGDGFSGVGKSGGKRRNLFKKDRVGVSSSVDSYESPSKETGGTDAPSLGFEDVPKLPFPENEESMYATLEHYSHVLDRYDVDVSPDYDGDFFRDFTSRGWRYPSGRRVPKGKWMVAYILRRQKIDEKMQETWL